MKRSRVWVLSCCISVAALLLPLAVQAWQRRTPRQTSSFAPSLLSVEEIAPAAREKRSPSAVESERELRMDVQRLYALASELKDEVNQGDSQQVLNVSMVRRVQDIEKLARQIRDRARR